MKKTWEYKYMYYCAVYVDKKHTCTAIFRPLKQMKTVVPSPCYSWKLLFYSIKYIIWSNAVHDIRASRKMKFNLVENFPITCNYMQIVLNLLFKYNVRLWELNYSAQEKNMPMVKILSYSPKIFLGFFTKTVINPKLITNKYKYHDKTNSKKKKWTILPKTNSSTPHGKLNWTIDFSVCSWLKSSGYFWRMTAVPPFSVAPTSQNTSNKVTTSFLKVFFECSIVKTNKWKMKTCSSGNHYRKPWSKYISILEFKF